MLNSKTRFFNKYSQKFPKQFVFFVFKNLMNARIIHKIKTLTTAYANYNYNPN